ncbi:MAG TPA: hypothetical protein VLG36_03145 [Candidatus Chromulinivoraceae bacterium]|nr:hypothetical protein [Candidatus Chromulinivoraceae bacterium]
MKPTRLEKTYLGLLMVIFGGIVLHAPLSVSLGVIFSHFELFIKSWKEILMVIAVPLAVVVIHRRRLWKELWSDWLSRLIAAFAALHFILIAIFYQGAAATAAGLAIDLRYLLFFCLVYVAIRAYPQYRKLFVQIGIAGASIVVGFAALQLFLPADILSHIGYGKNTIEPYLTVDKNPNYIRENSTLRGPNPLGAYGAMVLAFVTAAWVRKRERFTSTKIRIGVVVLAICAAISVWVSYSRSALIAAIIMVAIVLFVSVMRKVPPKAWVLTFAIVFAIAGGVFAAKGTSFVSNVILHENPNGGSSISSNAGHASSLANGVTQLVHQPLGQGVGSTGSASLFSGSPEIIENQYLFVAHEAGWFGLVLFSSISALVLIKSWRRRADWLALGVFASGIGMLFIGLLLPVWVDDTVSIIWWGLAAVAIGGEYARKSSK